MGKLSEILCEEDGIQMISLYFKKKPGKDDKVMTDANAYKKFKEFAIKGGVPSNGWKLKRQIPLTQDNLNKADEQLFPEITNPENEYQIVRPTLPPVKK